MDALHGYSPYFFAEPFLIYIIRSSIILLATVLLDVYRAFFFKQAAAIESPVRLM